MFRKHFRFRRKVFIALAFAALTAPAAQASTGVFVDGGPAPVSGVTRPAVQARSEHSYVAPAQAYVQTAATSERSYGVPGPDPSLVPQLVTSTSTGFDWRDAGIGASSAFGIALLLVLAVALARRNQHTGLTSA